MSALPGSGNVSVAAGPDASIVVTGFLDVLSVADARDEGVRLMDGDRCEVTFDLSGATVKGSAVIALLIAWQREARSREIEMSVVGASESLRQIADACGVLGIIPFADS